MLIRLRYGRRLQNSLKVVACVLLAAFYITFLFRESINAYEQNKEKTILESNVIANGKRREYEKGPKSSKHFLRQQRLHKLQQYRTNQTSSLSQTIKPTQLTTLNPVYDYSEEIHSATEKELEQRREHLNKVCKRYNLQSNYPPNPWEFFISPGHNIVWCNVFKAASSTWMYYFNVLGGYDIRFLQRTESQPLELARKRFPRPEINELLDVLPSSLSFLFVRNPFERIVSAYRNKLEGGRNPYYKTLGQKVIHQYRKSAIPGLRPKSGPTFEEFLKFLINEHKQKKRFDEHWAPIYSFCTPCSINFTIIGKVETFKRDSEYIIRQAGLESLLLGKLPKHKLRKIGNQASGIKTDALLERYFSEINRKTLDQLLDIYRLDFELFNYNFSKYYDVVQDLPTSIESNTMSSIQEVKADLNLRNADQVELTKTITSTGASSQ
ncbi:carbohydrate sulfotransferase 11 [Teleopsis dalmanni]|uniref:carbohydrate sulfotransferase 11 n=1 Tax=Teleopsis dalmanni TaxID=139649 RepID=UPI0018CFA085|nr:carbohydrate sulfotransferase 11 [Teleopsis dalmanni]